MLVDEVGTAMDKARLRELTELREPTELRELKEL